MVSSSAAIASLLSTGFISLAPNLILLLFSFDTVSLSSSTTRLFLNLGQSLAAGALLGDVFLHILPHASASSDETGTWILIGFSLFLMTDLLIRLLHQDQDDSDECCNGTTTTTTTTSTSTKAPLNNGDPVHEKQKRIKMSTVALNLIADALHNFTDGLAIGASFTAMASGGGGGVESMTTITSILGSRGGLATLSILLHEIPHELGDFCTLVQAGYSRHQAILAQFGTAVAAFVGTIAALVLSDTILTGDQLSFLTAGGFVYLAAVTILPEVLNGDQHDHTHSASGHTHGGTKKSVLYSIAQLLAFLCGIAFMHGVAMLEGHDHGHDHNHHHEVHLHHGHQSTEHHHKLPTPPTMDMEHNHHGHVHHDHHDHDHRHGEL